MQLSELPQGAVAKAIEYPHFPTPFQAVIWRNWGLVPEDRLCNILECTAEQLDAAAVALGLPSHPEVNPIWLKRSCNTLLRANWHILQYDQILTLLGWSADELSQQLRWDDFLWVKLGRTKPECIRAVYRELTPDEAKKTETIRQLVEKHFPGDEIKKSTRPFTFYDNMDGIPAGILPQKDKLRLAYSYSARYGDPLLDASLDPYPDKLLAALQKKGINAVYLQGILTQLSYFEDLPEISEGYETRIKNLNELIAKAAKYGIDVYLYLNEPRGFTPAQMKAHPFLVEKYSTNIDVGKDTMGMCTSKPAVREHLRKGLQYIAKNVPRLAGVFIIVASENPTNCWSHQPSTCECPVCNAKGAPAVYADVDRMIAEALHSVNPNIRVLCWDWGFYQQEWKKDFVELLPDNVTVLCTSENNMPIEIGGIKNNIGDYSISQPGPSPTSTLQWKRAQARGLKGAAKIQMSCSWELSAVPYIPVPQLVKQHLDNLKAAGVNDYLISWTLGGWPSMNMDMLNKTPEEMVVDTFGPAARESILKALQCFCDAFRQFPFAHVVLYYAPHNAGPMGLLYEKPTGYKSTMVGYPYDDLTSQRQTYPEDIFEQQWKKLSEMWRNNGMKALKEAEATIGAEYMDAYQDLVRIATACWCHFRSAYNQFAFHRRRNNPNALPKLDISSLLEEEISLAKTLLNLSFEDSRLGFEATNHYAYSPNDLREKVLNCEYLLAKAFRK